MSNPFDIGSEQGEGSGPSMKALRRDEVTTLARISRREEELVYELAAIKESKEILGRNADIARLLQLLQKIRM